MHILIHSSFCVLISCCPFAGQILSKLSPPRESLSRLDLQDGGSIRQQKLKVTANNMHLQLLYQFVDSVVKIRK
jgi:hypothetical protein